MLIRISLALTLATSLVACASSGKLAPLNAQTTDVMKHEGTWSGSFEGDLNGDLSFVLTAGRRTAQADGALASGESKKPLRFAEISIEGSTFRAVGKPYKDAECDCQVRTEFSGIIQGDIITGTVVHERDGSIKSAPATLRRD